MQNKNFFHHKFAPLCYNVGEVIPIYNVNEAVVAYYVSYLCDGEDAGYSILTLQNGLIEVLEFSFGQGANPFAELGKRVVNNKKKAANNKLYLAAPFEYAIKGEDGNFYYIKWG